MNMDKAIDRLENCHPITKEEMVFKVLPEKVGSWTMLEDITNI